MGPGATDAVRRVWKSKGSDANPALPAEAAVLVAVRQLWLTAAKGLAMAAGYTTLYILYKVYMYCTRVPRHVYIVH